MKALASSVVIFSSTPMFFSSDWKSCANGARGDVAADDDHVQRERFLVLVENAVAVGIHPSQRVENPLRFGRVVLDHRHFRVERPLVGRERSVHGAGRAVIEIGDDRLQIDARRQRAANALVREDRIVLVPADEVVVERVEPPEVEDLLHFGTAAFGHPDVGGDDRFVDVAAFDGLPGGVVVGDDFEEHVLEVRLHSPEIGAALEQNLFAGHAPDELERSGADGSRWCTGLEVALRVDVLRDGWTSREGRELRREDVLERDDDGVVRIDRRASSPDPTFRTSPANCAASDFGSTIFASVKTTSLAQDGASVGEGGLRIEVKRVLLAVRRNLVFVGQRAGRGRKKIRVELEQRSEEVGGDVMIVLGVDEERIERLDVALEPADDRAAVDRRGVIGDRRQRLNRPLLRAGAKKQQAESEGDSDTVHAGSISRGTLSATETQRTQRGLIWPLCLCGEKLFLRQRDRLRGHVVERVHRAHDHEFAGHRAALDAVRLARRVADAVDRE